MVYIPFDIQKYFLKYINFYEGTQRLNLTTTNFKLDFCGTSFCHCKTFGRMPDNFRLKQPIKTILNVILSVLCRAGLN